MEKRNFDTGNYVKPKVVLEETHRTGEYVSDFSELMKKKEEKKSFTHPQAEFYEDLNDSSVPQWLKKVAEIIGNGEPGVVITFPADRACEIPGLDLNQYHIAGIFENGDIYSLGNLDKFREKKMWRDDGELESDEDVLLGGRRIPGLAKIVCYDRSHGMEIRSELRKEKVVVGHGQEGYGTIESIPDFDQLMKQEVEQETFTHKQAQFFSDITEENTPQWLKYMGGLLGGGDERTAIVFSADKECSFPGLNLLDYRFAGVYENGDILYFEQDFERFNLNSSSDTSSFGISSENYDSEEEILLGKKRIQGLVKVVCISESYGGSQRILSDEK